MVQFLEKVKKLNFKNEHGAQARAQQQKVTRGGSHGVEARVAFLKIMLPNYIKTQYVSARRGSRDYNNNIC